MTPTDNIKDITAQLEKLLYGNHYEVSLETDEFRDCPTLDSFHAALKKRYNRSVGKNTPAPVTPESFWKTVNDGLHYRTDTVKRSPADEMVISQQADLFREWIGEFISEKTVFYKYPDELGLAGTIDFWGYTFLLLNEDRSSLLVCGAASE